MAIFYKNENYVNLCKHKWEKLDNPIPSSKEKNSVKGTYRCKKCGYIISSATFNRCIELV